MILHQDFDFIVSFFLASSVVHVSLNFLCKQSFYTVIHNFSIVIFDALTLPSNIIFLNYYYPCCNYLPVLLFDIFNALSYPSLPFLILSSKLLIKFGPWEVLSGDRMGKSVSDLTSYSLFQVLCQITMASPLSPQFFWKATVSACLAPVHHYIFLTLIS